MENVKTLKQKNEQRKAYNCKLNEFLKIIFTCPIQQNGTILANTWNRHGH